MTLDFGSPLLRVLAELSFVLVAGGAHSAAADESPNRPNIIVVMADDLGAKELGCYGNKSHRTPNLDRLAQEGIRFRTCLATPICQPSRYLILTGQNGFRTGILNNAQLRGGLPMEDPRWNLAQSHVTFAQVVQKVGYATALAGKWQLSGSLPDLIVECGFDEYCIWGRPKNLPLGRKQHRGLFEVVNKAPSRYWHPSILQNRKYRPTASDDYGPEIFTEFLIDTMSRRRGQPFLLYYPMVLAHEPFVSTPLDDAGERNILECRQERHFAGYVEFIDQLIGRLDQALVELGIREQTVLIFTADNGTQDDGKGAPTELAARVPLLISAPGQLPQGMVCDEIASLADILPTVAELAGAELPDDRTIDGESLTAVWQEDRTFRDYGISYIADYRLIRDQRWLLEQNHPQEFGRLYDCGDHRDGRGYVDVTALSTQEVLAAKEKFRRILQQVPAPVFGPPDMSGVYIDREKSQAE